MERARKRGWNLIALDLGVDTSTPSGEMMASVLATFAQFERRLIGQRTKDALAVKKAQGVRLGRPREMSEETVERIRELRRLGMSLAGHRARAERGRRPNRHGSRSLASPRRRAGALLGSFVNYASTQLRVMWAQFCPLRNLYQVPDGAVLPGLISLPYMPVIRDGFSPRTTYAVRER